ncbi:MAG TPA: c-type cytochrome [Planctomycetaceae bacterium]|nr:c-type cytochrome [Planctomycetaceae bacterium]
MTQAWPHLGSADRYIRHAARIAIEHRPRREWQQRALTESRPRARLAALLALARSFERPDRKTSGPDLDTPVPDWKAPPKAASDERAAVRDRILHALSQLDWEALASDQRAHLLRDYELTFLRVAPPTRKQRDALSALFESRLPSGHYHVDSELAQLLVYLQSPRAAELIVPLLESAPTQEAQIDFAKTLRHLRVGWNEDLRRRYFEWFRRAATFRGGAAFQLFVEFIKQDAIRTLTPEEKQKLGDLLKAPPVATALPAVTKPRPHVKDWTMEDLLPALQEGLHGRNFENGKKMFSAALCFNCHRFADEGGAIGPDLTGVGSRFSPKDILESIIHPSKTVSDQYAAISILTTNGRVVVGRIANLNGDRLMINTNMLEPGALTTVKRSDIEEMRLSRTSMMPEDLLNTLHKDEILDLLAYLIAGGDPDHRVFQQ